MLNAKPAVLANVSQDTRRVSDSPPLGVLLIAPSLAIIGGQSVQAGQLLRCLADESSIRVEFLAINPRLPSLLRIKYVRTAITLVLYLARLAVRAPRADLLHIFTPAYFAFYLAPAPALCLARILGKPAVLHYHDGRAADHLARWPLARKLLRLASAIAVPSDYLAGVFAQFGFNAVRIPNVAAARSIPYRQRSRPRPVFLHNRGLAPEYNPECTLRAFAIIQQRHPDARLTIAHHGPLRSSLESLARSLGLRHVEFVGAIPPERMAALYASADIYLMSPDADNMPLSVLECFAAGLPVVSSSAGGVPDLIQDGRNGLLFSPGDPAAMAGCALRLVGEPGLAARLAANGRADCERYSWPHIGPQWMLLYRRLSAASINSV